MSAAFEFKFPENQILQYKQIPKTNKYPEKSIEKAYLIYYLWSDIRCTGSAFKLAYLRKWNYLLYFQFIFLFKSFQLTPTENIPILLN